MEEDYLEGLVMASENISPRLRESAYNEMCHGVTVSNLAVALAQELGESQEFCDNIAVAGLLHDLGKLHLDKYLYHDDREDALAIERMKYVRMHPTQSYQVLCRENYPMEIAEAVYFHHENFDGTGYQANLKGEDIPWMARILRTCDVFSALTSDRSYRRAFDKDTAIDIMIDEVADYDMKVFLAFQRLLHSETFQGLDQLRTVVTPLQKEHLGMFIKEAEFADASKESCKK